MSHQWYVGCCHQNEEKRALENLERQDFEAYLPFCWVAWSNKPRIRPLFPSYIFINADMADVEKSRRIWSTRGVSTILCSGTHPAPVPGWMIDEIKGREVDGLVQLRPKDRVKYTNGEAVRIKGSPLDAIFSEPVDNLRAAVLISLLGRSQRLIVPLSKLTTGGSHQRPLVR